MGSEGTDKSPGTSHYSHILTHGFPKILTLTFHPYKLNFRKAEHVFSSDKSSCANFTTATHHQPNYF